MRFKVPQFIEIEDKIIGPLNLKQFLYIFGALGSLVIIYFFLEFWAFIIMAIIIMSISFAFAFYKFNGKPFIYLVINLFKYLTKPRLYLWKKNKQ